MIQPKFKVTLTFNDIGLILEALDSHTYWQLSDPKYRNDGYVLPPGSDDEDQAQEIEDCADLGAKLQSLSSVKTRPEAKRGRP